ncbi:unnamed protein product [Mycena citricolor]|uniref:Oxidation resistance protein 1 n=1 Tax=Mycena citricolor TaxID=2018698 RepID=A0AAD2Q3G3_9AGAR|nr:unnamed protein product [Mycena citricolor]
MTAPLDSIPVLTPVPASKPPKSPTFENTGSETFDHFSTRFLPPTPRASPVFVADPVPVPVHLVDDPTSPDSEFGSFVSGPTLHDPLSDALLESEPSTASQAFFEDTKSRAENNRGLLDELLLHEDEPLYFVKDEEQRTTSPDPEEHLLPSERPNRYIDDQLSDLDFDYFSKLPAATPAPVPVPTLHKRASSSSSSFSFLRSSATRPTLAPPLASKSSSDDAPGHEQFHPSSPPASSSYASLATISKSSGAKWVASLLPTVVSSPTGIHFPHTSSSADSLSESVVLPPQRAPALKHFTPFAPSHSQSEPAPTGAPGFRGGASYDWDRGFSRALEHDLGVDRSKQVVDDPSVKVLGSAKVDVSRNGNGNGHGHGVGVLLEKSMVGLINLVGRREGTTPVLMPELMSLIHPHLPALLRLSRQWSLLYSLDQHGISLNTLYSRCEPPASTRVPHPKGALVVIQDSGNMVFGVWLADGLRRSTRGSYYGGGESFLWRYSPSAGKFNVYKWTGRNDYVALCEDGFISFGGGDGHYGLYLDDSLFDGSSARCPTFDNDPLCSGSPSKSRNVDFECVGLEVWGVGP